MPRGPAFVVIALALASCNASSCAAPGRSDGPLRCTPAELAVHIDGLTAPAHANVSGIHPRWPDGGLLRRADGGLSLATPGFRFEGELPTPLCGGGQGPVQVQLRAWFLDDVSARNPEAPDLAPGTYPVKLPWGTDWPPMRQAELVVEQRWGDGGRSFCGATAGSLSFTKVAPARIAGSFDFALGTDHGADAGELTGWFDLAPCERPARPR